MGKILIILSIALAAIAAGLGYINRGVLVQTKDELVLSRQEATNTKTALAAETVKIAALEKNLADLTLQKQDVESQVNKLKAEVAATTSQVTDLTAKLGSKESELAVANTDIQAKTEEIARINEQLAGVTAPPVADDSQTRITELETLNTKLQGDLDGARSKLEGFERIEKEKLTRTALANLTGRILAVNQAWNFVVLNIGDRNGILSNTELIVKRGSIRIGKVRITSVEPATSIADIIPSAMSRGLSIQPGDDVIYQTQQN